MLDNNHKYKYNGKGENKMENMSVYSVVVYYTGGSSRGYLISAEAVSYTHLLWLLDKNKNRKKWKVPPFMINKTAAAYIFPCLWAFCSPYTKNRTKQKPEQMRI